MAAPIENEEDFEALLQQSAGRPRRHVHPGERVAGKIVFIGEKHATVDLGDGLDGLLDLAGTTDKEGHTRLRVGDKVDAFALRYRDRVVELTMSLGRGQANEELLRDAAVSGMPVEGTVLAVNKGGYEVDISGTKGFCPLGQMELRRIDDPAVMIGQKLKFRVTEVRGGRDVTLSRRALLEEEQGRRAEQTRQQITPGARLPGIVTAVRDFGAFVDLGGLEGFIPASELAWGRKRPQDVVEAGQTVEVEVLRIEPGLDHKGRPVEKIALSMRAIARDPFEALQPHLPPGTVLRGYVTRVEQFGAFVELIPGVEGLIHVSAFGKRIGRPADVVQPAQDIAVRVVSIDPLARRIALAYLEDEKLDELVEPTAAHHASAARILGRMKTEAAAAETSADAMAYAPSVPRMVRPSISVGAVHEVTVDKVEPFGVFVSWEGGRGLVPNMELGLPHGADARRTSPVGAKFKAVVQEVRSDGKVRLSRIAALAAEERADADDFMTRQRVEIKKPKGQIGSLGEMLLAKLGKKP